MNKKLEIPLFKVFMSEESKDNVKRVLSSGYIGEGPEEAKFEKELKEYFNIKDYFSGNHIRLTNSATSAEHLLYYMLQKDRDLIQKYPWGISKVGWPAFDPSKHHVLTTPLTCTATNWPILSNRMAIKWYDVDAKNLGPDLEDLERKIDENTRIITVVHWGGNPIDMDSLKSLVNKKQEEFGTRILIIEDCAHAFGAKYKDDIKSPFVGFTGNFSTFSLQAIKHITSGDGGFLVSPYEDFYEKARLLSWYGIDRSGPRVDFRCEENIEEVGFKFHMNDISAAIGRGNLMYAPWILDQNRTNAKFYNENLKDISGIDLIPENGLSSYWLYTFHVEDRFNFMRKMHEYGISTSRVHERNDKHTCVSKFKTELPGVDKANSTMICIPVGFWVSPEKRDFIVNKIKEGW